LVTGGGGFLGTNLIKKLFSLGESVICLDNLSTGKKKNIEELLNIGKSKFEFINKDIIFPLDIKNISQIFHMACPASPKQYRKNSLNTIKTSILGAFSALELAKRNNAKILFTSTSEIYGEPEVFHNMKNIEGM
jgi:UDP-glucuronate decarboxylase